MRAAALSSQRVPPRHHGVSLAQMGRLRSGPERAEYAIPGQRPGPHDGTQLALKGRHNSSGDRTLCRTFSAMVSLASWYPGRCPGLMSFAPLVLGAARMQLRAMATPLRIECRSVAGVADDGYPLISSSISSVTRGSAPLARASSIIYLSGNSAISAAFHTDMPPLRNSMNAFSMRI